MPQGRRAGKANIPDYLKGQSFCVVGGRMGSLSLWELAVCAIRQIWLIYIKMRRRAREPDVKDRIH